MRKLSLPSFLVGGMLLSVMIGCISVYAQPVSAAESLNINSSGALADYIKAEQTFVGTSFDASYQRIYTILQRTGMSLLKTVDYQSLVCLGVLPAQSIFAQLQTDKMNIKTSFTKDFIELENRLSSIEEKYRLQQENKLDFFNGSSYQDAKTQLKADIDRITAVHTGFIQGFESGYKTKILKFISDYAQYLGQNKDLLQSINARIVKLQYLLNQESIIDSGINQLYSNLQIDEVMSKVPVLQNSLQQVFLSNITPYIDTQVKKFKALTLLSGALAQIKTNALEQYSKDKDVYLTQILSPWYNYAEYQKIKQQLQTIRATYYPSDVLNCTKILSSVQDSTEQSLFTSVSSTTARILSGIALSKTSASLKDKLLSGMQTFFSTSTSQKILAFKKLADTTLTQITKNAQSGGQPASPVLSGTVVSPNVQTPLPVNFVFTKPFTPNQRHADIGILQQFLRNQGYYTGTISSIYSPATKDALYTFQSKYGLVKSTDRKDLRGYFGPATRAKVNSLLK